MYLIMKYFKNLLKNKKYILIGFFVLISIFLHIRQINFPPLNSDEASFAYNAYSILESGRDEYGKFMPLRFKAFGENKLPVTIYTIVPFISIFGLNDISARLPFILIGVISPVLFFLITKKITDNFYIALIASFLASISPFIQIMSRHIHEDLIILVLTIGIVYYLIKLREKFNLKNIAILSVLIGASLLTYHIGKITTLFALFWIFYTAFSKKITKKMFITTSAILLIPIFLFGITEILNPTTRVSNLFITSNEGFTASIIEQNSEHNNRLIHNKAVFGFKKVADQYLSYFSPEFLVQKGDSNVRFGFEGISPISHVEYLMIFFGVYYFFKRKVKDRYLLLSLLFVAPFAAALSWQENSITRSFILIIPLLIFSATGFIQFGIALEKIIKPYLSVLFILLISIFITFLSWDFYFLHYSKRPEVQSAWQAGYKEVGDYLRENYDDFDRFYISKSAGQPYIFVLFYLKYPPSKYQKQASLTALDEYGFGQVEKFDKFIFDSKAVDPNESAVFIAPPDDLNINSADKDKIIKIKNGNNDLFFIYEGRRNK